MRQFATTQTPPFHVVISDNSRHRVVMRQLATTLLTLSAAIVR